MRAPLAERFWQYVEPEPNSGCFLWAGATAPNGYGVIRQQRDGWKYSKAHRVSYELHRGPIPAGALVCHTCDVPACVRPEHLFLGDSLANNRDMVAKGRQRWPGAPRIITDEQVATAKRRYAEGGVTYHALAKDLGVATMTIWKRINGPTGRR